MKCDACKQNVASNAFTQKQLVNKQQQGIALVCPECTDRGCTPKVPHMHSCSVCETIYGYNKYDPKQWMNFETQHRKTLVCEKCQARLKDLKPLIQKSKYKCNCKQKIGHAERCPLTATLYGTKRWPGQDQGLVDAEDLKILNALRPQWWLRALRKEY